MQQKSELTFARPRNVKLLKYLEIPVNFAASGGSSCPPDILLLETSETNWIYNKICNNSPTWKLKKIGNQNQADGDQCTSYLTADSFQQMSLKTL